MEQKHILFRFFSEKDYLEQFLNGSIYMNSMHYFWDEYSLADATSRKRKIIAKNPCLNPDNIRVPLNSKAPHGQMDMMEGTIATADSFKMGFDNEFAIKVSFFYAKSRTYSIIVESFIIHRTFRRKEGDNYGH